MQHGFWCITEIYPQTLNLGQRAQGATQPLPCAPRAPDSTAVARAAGASAPVRCQSHAKTLKLQQPWKKSGESSLWKILTDLEKCHELFISVFSRKGVCQAPSTVLFFSSAKGFSTTTMHFNSAPNGPKRCPFEFFQEIFDPRRSLPGGTLPGGVVPDFGQSNFGQPIWPANFGQSIFGQ